MLLTRIRIAFVLSVLFHAAIFSIPLRQRAGEASLGSMLPGPLTVQIVPAEAPSVAEAAPPEPIPEARPLPPRPPAPRPPAPRQPAQPVEPSLPPVVAAEPRAAPQFDMMAAINARRERRRAAEAAAGREPAAPQSPSASADEAATAAINRNLRTAPTEGVGGVFQILRKGARTAEFAFNGWRPESYRQWREVIEVDAGPGGDVERAIVRRMIQLIRSHYQGDFKWESHKLGRTIVLSARPEDNDGLEDFLVREFFGTPTIR